MDIPFSLKHAIENGECTLFIGAGIGKHLKTLNNDPAPDATDLANALISKFDIQTRSADLAKIASFVEAKHGRVELETFVKNQLANFEPDKILQWLFTFRWKAIFTTNYDRGIQRSYELISHPKQIPITISATAEMEIYDPRIHVPIYHLHGALFGVSKSPIVITEQDYRKFREQRNMLFRLLQKEFALSTILYIGYSNRDPNWRLIHEEMQEEFYPSLLPNSFRVDPITDPVDIDTKQFK